MSSPDGDGTAPAAYRWLARAPAWVAGAALVLAGLTKAGQPLVFGRAIAGYQLLPVLLVPVVAVVLPWLEVAAGALLLGGRLRLGAAALAVGLGVGFLGAGLSVLVRGLDVHCGCFGAWSGSVGALSIAIEVAFVGSAALALRAAAAAGSQSPST